MRPQGDGSLDSIAVGGIAAGQRIKGYGMSCQVLRCKETSVDAVLKAQIPLTVKLEAETYTRMCLGYHATNGREEYLEFWVAPEITDEIELLYALANGYRPVVIIAR